MQLLREMQAAESQEAWNQVISLGTTIVESTPKHLLPNAAKASVFSGMGLAMVKRVQSGRSTRGPTELQAGHNFTSEAADLIDWRAPSEPARRIVFKIMMAYLGLLDLVAPRARKMFLMEARVFVGRAAKAWPSDPKWPKVLAAIDAEIG